MRSKFIFLHVHIYFDMQKCEFSLKHSNSNCWLCFETGVIEVEKKEMLREFGCNYFSTKIS